MNSLNMKRKTGVMVAGFFLMSLSLNMSGLERERPINSEATANKIFALVVGLNSNSIAQFKARLLAAIAQKAFDINAVNEKGSTLLLSIFSSTSLSAQERYDLVKFLIEHGLRC